MQSLNTDQGTSDFAKQPITTACGRKSLNPSIQIRAVPTDGHGAGNRIRRQVSTPQYRSGQFRLFILVNKDFICGRLSQSLNTDQGSSDSAAASRASVAK